MKDRIGFCGGGNMAEALVRGLLHSKMKAPDQIEVSDVKAERLAHLAKAHGVRTTCEHWDASKPRTETVGGPYLNSK